ncbi:TPA: hypothetical protein R4S64_001981 [Kluyvera georgiana]|nr:hypothetical protein [Kluyvera georgiana]
MTTNLTYQTSQLTENDLISRLLGRAKYLRDIGEVKTPELLEAAACELQERREAMKPLAGIDLESAVDRLAENCNNIQGAWCSDKRSAYYSGFRDGAAIGLNAEKNGDGDE